MASRTKVVIEGSAHLGASPVERTQITTGRFLSLTKYVELGPDQLWMPTQPNKAPCAVFVKVGEHIRTSRSGGGGQLASQSVRHRINRYGGGQTRALTFPNRVVAAILAILFLGGGIAQPGRPRHIDRISFSSLALQASENSRGAVHELPPVAHRPALTWAILHYHIEFLSFKRHLGGHKQDRAELFVYPFSIIQSGVSDANRKGHTWWFCA